METKELRTLAVESRGLSKEADVVARLFEERDALVAERDVAVRELAALREAVARDPRPRVTEVEGVWMVERSRPLPGVDPAETGPVPVRLFPGPAAYVGVRYATTINLGNYESSRIEVSISLPCHPAEVTEQHRQAQAWATARLGVEVDAVRAVLAARDQEPL